MKNISKLNQKGFGHHIVLPIFVVAVIAAIGSYVIVKSRAASNPFDSVRQSKLVDNPSRGLTYKGLRAIKENANHPCHGKFEVEDVKADNQPLCTHGPDPAPEGVDVSNTSVDQSIERVKKISEANSSKKIIPADDNDQLLKSITPATVQAAGSASIAGSTIPCGRSGKLVQLMIVYDHTQGPYDIQFVTTVFQMVARSMETQVRVSALYSGPGATSRSIRFATTADCSNPTVGVNDFRLSSNPTYSEVVKDLQSRGYNRSDRKYLVWIMHNTSMCGIGSWFDDSRLTLSNDSNTHTGYALVGPACWGYGELHELMHNLGAVQDDAPHTSGAGHCIEDYDIMCYADGANGKAANGKTVYVSPTCNNTGLEDFLDCNHNDYFSTAPSILPSSSQNYLHDHWNTAISGWLNRE